MDDIAQKAGISRAALYLLFPNKEAIFRTLVEELHQAALGRAEAALRAEGTLAKRLVAAFEGKDLALMEVVRGSAHGAELVDLKHAIGADITAHAEDRFKELLAQVLQQADSRGEITLVRIELDAHQAAELLVFAVYGFKQLPSDLTVYRQRLTQFIRVFSTAVNLPDGCLHQQFTK